MTTPNWIHLRANQHATYIVNGTFDYFLQLSPGSSATFQSAVPNGTVTITKNIWGPGSTNFQCNANVAGGSIGVAPAAGLLTAQSYQYTVDRFTEHIP